MSTAGGSKCGQNCFSCGEINKLFDGAVIPGADRGTHLRGSSRTGVFASAYMIWLCFERPAYVALTEEQVLAGENINQILSGLRSSYPDWHLSANLRREESPPFNDEDVSELIEFAERMTGAEMIEYWNGAGSCTLSIRLLKSTVGGKR